MEVQPPFLRPPLTEAQLEAKVLDNGIQNDRHSTRVSDTKSNKHRLSTDILLVYTLDLTGWSDLSWCCGIKIQKIVASFCKNFCLLNEFHVTHPELFCSSSP